MLLTLKNINYYFLTCDNQIRKNHIMEEFKEHNLIEVNPIMNIGKYRSGPTGFSKILDLACQNQDKNKPFQPFVILEDDVKKYREFPENLNIPDDCDILYIGLSNWGMTYKRNVHNNISFTNIDENIVKIYNMLASHGMIICSIRGLLNIQKCMFEAYFNNKAWDYYTALIQPYLNVYALKEPLVYQYGEIGGEEKDTKINLINCKDKKINENWINKENISIQTLYNK